jgi:hypothetical protein
MGAKVPAWQRLSAYDLGVAIDSWCQTMLNKGLAYFQCDAILDLPQASRCKEDPEDGWGLLSEDSPAPCLAMGADQGSSGWSLTWFMLNYLRLMCMPFLDPFHRLWRDHWLGAQQAGIHVSILVVGLQHNLAHGPWDTDKWFVEQVEAAHTWLNNAGASDPILAFVHERILIDRGMADLLGSEEALPVTLEIIKGSKMFRQKGPRISTSRWASFIDAQEWWDDDWWVRAALLLFMGLRLGWLTLKKECLKVSALAPKFDEGRDTKCAKSVQASLRDRCKNALHVVCCILLEPIFLFHARLLLLTTDTTSN